MGCPFLLQNEFVQETNMSGIETASNQSYDQQLDDRLSQLGGSPVEESAPQSSLESVLNDSELMQSITRRQSGGHDTFVGYFRCRFAAGQQRYSLHIPLYPAMEKVPDVEVMPIEADEVKARVTDRQKFGLRIELVLPKPTKSDQQILVEVTAYAQANG